MKPLPTERLPTRLAWAYSWLLLAINFWFMYGTLGIWMYGWLEQEPVMTARLTHQQIFDYGSLDMCAQARAAVFAQARVWDLIGCVAANRSRRPKRHACSEPANQIAWFPNSPAISRATL